MSDGPFLSPAPQACWNPVLECAGNVAYSIEELQEAIPPALAAECRAIPKRFFNLMEGLLAPKEAGALFGTSESGGLEALREAAEGEPLAVTIAEWCEDFIESGPMRPEAPVDALIASLWECWGQRSRMLEEHAEREAIDKTVARITRERLRQAAPSDEMLRQIARAILKPDGENLPTSPKRTDLDEVGPVLDQVGSAPLNDEKCKP